MNLYINIYDPEWNGVFSNEKIKNNEKRIFLIGASNVYSIDVDGTDVVNLKINRLKDKRK